MITMCSSFNDHNVLLSSAAARGIRKVVSAVKHFNRHTCIRFVPRTDQEEYVEFQLHATYVKHSSTTYSIYTPDPCNVSSCMCEGSGVLCCGGLMEFRAPILSLCVCVCT